jgi:hypothetical protein
VVSLTGSERAWVRVWASLLVVLMSFAFLPFMLILKVAEGVYVSARILKDCLAQVWDET